MPYLAALLATSLVAYTTYTFFPIPAAYWTRRLEDTFATLDEEETVLPAWRVPLMMLAPYLQRFAPLEWLRGIKNKLYWAQQLGRWRTWDEASFAALVLLGGMIGFVLGVMARGDALMLLVVTGLGALLPYTQMNGKAKQAQRTFRRQLPEITQLIAMELAGGSSMTEALERVSRGRNLTSRWLRETIRSAHGRSLFSHGGQKGVLYQRSLEAGLPELASLAQEIDNAQALGIGGKENLSRMAVRSAKEYLAVIDKKAASLPNELVPPAVLFFFLPFVAAVIIPIALPLLQSLQVR